MTETLDIIPLRTFVAIADCGGFGRAAAALHMSQPTVSQHVRQLERRIDQPLVRREGRRAALTPAGERLLAEARRILAVHDEALARLDVAQDRSLVVGSTETAAEQVLPGLLTTIRDAFPEHRVLFRIDRSTQMVDAVDKGTIDLAVVLDTGSTVPGLAVGTLPLTWFASPSWEQSDASAPLPLVAYAEPCGMRQRALQRLGAEGRDVEITAESGTLEGVLASARAGLGVAVLPSAGRAPEGLVERTDFPALGSIAVRLVVRRGVDPLAEETALAALDRFFAAPHARTAA
ncbi:LysR family transcriptional regulator [Microbacterium sp. gxy059]|uniref:LysR family transcriptional regulator n=1 Tax=Microbacterium sp. gxy059 TaxID=2957199 RepID=UPI003D956B7D